MATCLSKFSPGVAPRARRTASIDYAIVLSGEIELEIDDDVVHLKAGGVLVQCGTIHNWDNNGTKSCRIAFILIDRKLPGLAGDSIQPIG